MKNQRVLISGASIAGPVLAYWLNRYGFDVVVVERAPQVRDGGYAIDLRGTAVEVVERMGLLPQIREQSTHLGGMSYVNAKGKRVATMGTDSLGGAGFVAEVELLRGDLARIFYDATAGDVEYLLGNSITSITEGADSVRVEFTDAAPREFDLVFGADGVHSNVRSLVFGDESQFLRHLGCYISIFTTENLLDLDRWGLFYNTPGKAAGIQSARDNTEAKAMFYWNTEPLVYDRRDIDRQKQLLTEAFAGQGWEVQRILATLPDAPDFVFDSVCQIIMDKWSKGRVALVGDAGYCAGVTAATATSLAVVGAYILAGELKVAGDDHTLAFQRYQDEMQSYVEANRELAPKNAKGLLPTSNLGIFMRNMFIKALPYLPGTSSYEKIATSVTLKDYEKTSAAGQKTVA